MKSILQIDSGIKPPLKNIHVETIKKMRVNDSVFFDSKSEASKFLQAMYQQAQGKSWRQLMRKVEGGWRVWKVSRKGNHP